MFVGVDIGKFHHVAAFLDQNGKDLSPVLGFTNSQEGFDAFFAHLKSLPQADPPVVAMEATGHYWLNLYAVLLDCRIECHVINPIQTEAMRRMSIRKTKTDSVDSRYIAQVLRLGDYSDITVQEQDIQELRQLCRYRFGLVDSVSAIKNKVTAILDRIFPEYPRLFGNMYCKTSLELLKRYTTPEVIGKLPFKRLATMLKKRSLGHLGEDKAHEILKAAKSSVGNFPGDALVFQLRQQIQQIEYIQEHIAQVEKKIVEYYRRFPCYLETIPGMGIVCAAAILSEIGDVSRFSSDKKLIAFAGFDASVHQSGTYSANHASMSKRGSPYLRRALWTAAECASRNNPVFIEFYERKRAEGKNHMTAIGACGRKMCCVVFAILRDKTPFDPKFDA